ncbi:hypothetical protein F0562_004505 [Nyssa sinensis]|uniref:Transcription and mRNA export factor ENY2 n=1 Tax=Nyssa sinensis TaxID=561372 RepID=A0A5J5C021_9ASTE|nr:hypothetical protein F0562_004505 [Nyssa sinensis]
MRHSVNRPPTPDAREDQEKEPTFQEIINIKMIESGEKERLMELLRERLTECGWKDEMKALCRAFIKKKGRNNVTVDDLVHVITPKGRGKEGLLSFFFSVILLIVCNYRFLFSSLPSNCVHGGQLNSLVMEALKEAKT